MPKCLQCRHDLHPDREYCDAEVNERQRAAAPGSKVIGAKPFTAGTRLCACRKNQAEPRAKKKRRGLKSHA